MGGQEARPGPLRMASLPRRRRRRPLCALLFLPCLPTSPHRPLLCTQMVGTRSRKRAAAPTEEPAAAVTVDQVLAAVDACRAAILEHAATVSTSQVLELCRQQLGLPDVAPLRPHRQAAKERALQLLEAQVMREGPLLSTGACTSHLMAFDGFHRLLLAP